MSLILNVLPVPVDVTHFQEKSRQQLMSVLLVLRDFIRKTLEKYLVQSAMDVCLGHQQITKLGHQSVATPLPKSKIPNMEKLFKKYRKTRAGKAADSFVRFLDGIPTWLTIALSILIGGLLFGRIWFRKAAAQGDQRAMDAVEGLT